MEDNKSNHKTERIAIFALIAAATMVLAFSATIGTTTQQATALKSGGGASYKYCYSYQVYDTTSGEFYTLAHCYPNKGACNKAQSADFAATSGCYKFPAG
jgi:hypothetical protein